MTDAEPSIQWLTTQPNPRSSSFGYDAGQRGWRTHAVRAGGRESFGEIASRSASCGLAPAHGWGMDLFIVKKCCRCLRLLKLECAACRGGGCALCRGSGERNPDKTDY